MTFQTFKRVFDKEGNRIYRHPLHPDFNSNDPLAVVRAKAQQEYLELIHELTPFIKWVMKYRPDLSYKTLYCYYRCERQIHEQEVPAYTLEMKRTPNFGSDFALWILQRHKYNQLWRTVLIQYQEFLNFTYGTNDKLVFPSKQPERKFRLYESFSPEEIERIANYLREKPYRDGNRNKINKWYVLFIMSYELALRVHEALSITPNSFDFNLWLKDTSKRCHVRILGKGNKDRKISSSPAVTEAILRYISHKQRYLEDEILGGQQLTKEQIEEFRNQPIFGEISYNAWCARLRKTTKSMFGNKFMRPHNIRSARATHIYMSGIDLLTIKDFLGHSNALITEMYIKKTGAMVISKFEEIDKKDALSLVSRITKKKIELIKAIENSP